MTVFFGGVFGCYRCYYPYTLRDIVSPVCGIKKKNLNANINDKVSYQEPIDCLSTKSHKLTTMLRTNSEKQTSCQPRYIQELGQFASAVVICNVVNNLLTKIIIGQ